MKQDTTKIKYFLYARKSSESEDRQMASIDSQIGELKNIAKQNNLEIIEVFSESKSAKAPGRPIFNEMIARIKKGEASGVVCWKLNRLARNPIDGGEISWMIQQGIVRHIQTFGRSYYPTDNVIVMAVELGLANQFIRDLSTDTKRGMRAKAERGYYPSYSTLGYIHNPNKKKGEKEIIEDPERFDLTRKMFDLMLTGNYTPPKILDIATNEWGLRSKYENKISRSTIYRIFTDTFYYGSFEYPKKSGNWFQGKHKPMITLEEYDKIQEILGRKGKPRPKTHSFAFTGLIRCGECGAMITAEDKIKKQKNGNIHRYTYYHCTKRKNPNCSQRTIENKVLEKQIIEVLEKIEIPPEFCEWALEAIKSENQKENEDRNKILVNIQKQYNASVQKLDRLIDMRANNEIDEEQFANKKSDAMKEKTHFQELLNDTDNRINKWIEDMEKAFIFAQSANEKFKNGTLEEKRSILSALGSNLSLKDQKFAVSIQKPLMMIKSVAPEVKAISKRLEPLKNGINKRTLSEIYAQSPMMLRRQDFNRNNFFKFNAIPRRHTP